MIASSALTARQPVRRRANVIFGGTWGGKAIAIVAMISIFGVLNGWILLQGRAAPRGAGRALPAAVRPRRRPRRQSSGSSSRPCSSPGSAPQPAGSGSIVDMFTDIIILAALTALIPYLYAASAQLYLFFADRESFSAVPRPLLGDRLPRARLLDLGDLGRRLRVHRQGVHAPDRRHPGLPLGALAPEGQEAPAIQPIVIDDTPDPFSRPSLELVVSASVTEQATSLYVGSEVGTLRRVILHRPDLELRRLPLATRTTCSSTTSSGSSGPAGARRLRRRAHGARGRGPPPRAPPRGDGSRTPRAPGCPRWTLRAANLKPQLGPAAQMWLEEMTPTDRAHSLIGGVAWDELPFRASPWPLSWPRAATGSCCRRSRTTCSPATPPRGSTAASPSTRWRPARTRESIHLDAIYRHHPLFAGREFEALE